MKNYKRINQLYLQEYINTLANEAIKQVYNKKAYIIKLSSIQFNSIQFYSTGYLLHIPVLGLGT